MRYGHLSGARADCARKGRLARGLQAFAHTAAGRHGAAPAHRHPAWSRWLAAWAGAGLLLLGGAAGGRAWAADPLEVVQLVLAEREIAASGQQIVQITLRGTTARPMRAGVRVELRDERDGRVGKAMDRVVQVGASGDHREFFRFEVPNRFGKFTVRVELFTPDFKARLLTGDPAFFAPFTIGSQAEPGLAATPKSPGAQETPVEPGKPGKPGKGPPTFAVPKGLFFEKPDLVWENLDIQPPNLLVGEPLKIKADLRNVGGDIARNIEVKVDYFNTRLPGRLIPVAKPTVQVLAPGDKVELEFETLIPEDAALGDYKVQLQIDPANQIQETTKDNNTLVSDAPIKLSIIKLVFPEPGYYFEQAGLFLFRWDSRRFDEFKVQVGTDSAFATPGSAFDIPQGEKWTKDREIVPLEGELPDMAVGLMQKARTDQLYWRVVGRSATLGVQTVSQASPFAIRRAAKSADEGQPAPGAPAPGGQTPPKPPAGPRKAVVPAPQAAAPPAAPSESRRPVEMQPRQ